MPWAISIFEQHAAMLEASGITPEHATRRGYVSVDTKKRLEQLRVTAAGRNVPGLLIPQRDIRGSVWGYQYRPDQPRERDGKPVKYETPYQQRNGIDVPPGVGPLLADPTIPLVLTEGVKKADAAALAGLACVALPGVWSWRGKNGHGGKTAIPDWHDVALNDRRVILAFDSDVTVKPAVRRALDELASYLRTKDARVEYAHLPDEGDGKTGLDDYLAAHSVDEFWTLVHPDPPAFVEPDSSDGSECSRRGTAEAMSAKPIPLSAAVETFGRWLHLDDHAPLLVVAASIVANCQSGDPVWLLIVGPPSGGKTEVLSSCATLPYIVKAATVSEAALLSGTSKKDRAKDATGGLLRQIGEFGIILCKDFTSVLSQNRDTAKQAMAALREIYDGSWDRPIGGEGGRILSWAGKCGLVGGVTPSYDRYGTIVNALGDRFVLLRMPDVAAERQALSALDSGLHETEMRRELAAAMIGLIAGADAQQVNAELDDDERRRLVALATFAATARTAVERDGYSGDLLVMPQAEGPARLVKVLRRLYGGLAAIGVDTHTRWELLARIVRDCAPAIRLPLMTALVAAEGPRRTSDLATKCGLVTKTAHRQLDDLALLGIAEQGKKGNADNSPDMWSATQWLRKYWPPEVGQKTTTNRVEVVKETDVQDTDDSSLGGLGTFLSHSPDVSRTTPNGNCAVCGLPLDPAIIAEGGTTHLGCFAEAA